MRDSSEPGEPHVHPELWKVSVRGLVICAEANSFLVRLVVCPPSSRTARSCVLAPAFSLLAVARLSTISCQGTARKRAKCAPIEATATRSPSGGAFATRGIPTATATVKSARFSSAGATAERRRGSQWAVREIWPAVAMARVRVIRRTDARARKAGAVAIAPRGFVRLGCRGFRTLPTTTWRIKRTPSAATLESATAAAASASASLRTSAARASSVS